MPPLEQKAQQFDFYRYLRVFWRRKWLLIIPLAVCIPLSLAAAYFYPREYESRAILELQDNRPAGEPGHRRVNVRDERHSVSARMLSWNTVRDIVLSRKVEFGREIDADDRRELERIYYQVRRRTRVAPFGSKHLDITHRSTRPEMNASLVNELVKKFVGDDRRVAQEKAKVDLKYYREKLAVARAHLAEIDAQLREFIQSHTWLSDDLPTIHSDYKDAEAKVNEIRHEIAEAQANIAKLRKDLAKEEPEIIEMRTIEPSEEVKAARKAAKAARDYFDAVNGTYTRAHRRWREARGRLQGAEARLKEVDKGGEDQVEESRPNPRYAGLQERIREATTELGKLEVRTLRADKEVSETYVRLRKAPGLLAQKRGLEEARESAATTAREYEDGSRAADRELQRLLTEAYSSKFKVLEYGREDRRPVKSTKLKIVALGIILGILIGFGLVALVEYLDQTFKTIDDARTYLGLPALGVIPLIFTPRDHRRRLWFRVLAVSSVVFVVGVAVAIYLMVPATQEYLSLAWAEFKDWISGW